LFLLHGASFSDQVSESEILLYGEFWRFAMGLKAVEPEAL